MKYRIRNILSFFLLMFFGCTLSMASRLQDNTGKSACTVSLNGSWEMGYDRKYTKTVMVPGIHTDPTRMEPALLWYRREVILPGGKWKYATLELKGARFSPRVYVNRIIVSQQNGGMAPTFHLLKHKDVKPGSRIILEIALLSLKDLSEADASYIPVENPNLYKAKLSLIEGRDTTDQYEMPFGVKDFRV